MVQVYVVDDGTIVDPLFAGANEKVLPVHVVTVWSGIAGLGFTVNENV